MYSFVDFYNARIIDLGSLRVRKSKMVQFAKKFDPQDFHLNLQSAAETWYGDRIASGSYIFALWMRSLAIHVLCKSPSLGSPGCNFISWKAPVYAKDILKAQTTIVSSRRSASLKNVGIVVFHGNLTRDGSEVFACEMPVFMRLAR